LVVAGVGDPGAAGPELGEGGNRSMSLARRTWTGRNGRHPAPTLGNTRRDTASRVFCLYLQRNAMAQPFSVFERRSSRG
jgi:hypothetical protein